MVKKTQMEIATTLAKELQEFFTNTYAEGALQAALDSNNNELLLLSVNHFDNLRQQILDAEEYNAEPSDEA